MKQTMRGYSVIEIKSVDTEQRIIEGTATTIKPDRTEDVVVPTGGTISLPLPFLYQHNSRQPIGQVTAAKVTDDGIKITARIAKGVAPFIDEAWALITAGLVRGLSIGFRAIKDPTPIKGTFGLRFDSWELLEVSAVTVPANADCSIHLIKSIDQPFLRAASGETAGVRVVRLTPSPGVSGPIVVTPRTTMKTIKERITDFQAARMAKAAQLTALLEKQDGGATLDAAEQESFDTLDAEVTEIDGHLKRLERAEQLSIKQAVAVSTEPTAHAAALPRPNSGIISVRSNLEPGVKMARWVQANLRGNWQPQQVLQAIQADKMWMSSTPELEMVAKAAVPAADTTTAGWASELVYAQNLANEFIEFLRPKTIVGRIQGFSRVPFKIRVGGLSSGLTGYWVGEGKAIPVSKGATISQTLDITKAAGIASLTKELVRLSTPSAELMIRNELAKAIVETIDDAFINPNNGGIANEKPASMLYGVTPVTPTGTSYAAFRTDVQTLMETSFDANLDTEGSVWLMSHTMALKLAMMVNALDQRTYPDMTPNGGTLLGYPVITSQKLQIPGSPQYENVIIFLHPGEVFMADDGQVTIEASDQVSLQLLDNPTQLSTGATAPTTVVSMFQTESVAVKGVRFINWGKKRTTAAQWISTAAYVG